MHIPSNEPAWCMNAAKWWENSQNAECWIARMLSGENSLCLLGIYWHSIGTDSHLFLKQTTLVWCELQHGFFQWLWNTVQKLTRCSWKVWPDTRTSSMYTNVTWRGRPARTRSVNLSNVAGALHKLKGMTVNCHSPFPIENAVFSLAVSSILTCQ